MSIKKYITSALTTIAKWCGISLVATPATEIVKEALRLCINAEETYPTQSGEYKRHQVFAKLIKVFPDSSKRQLGIAIELAVRMLP